MLEQDTHTRSEEDVKPDVQQDMLNSKESEEKKELSTAKSGTEANEKSGESEVSNISEHSDSTETLESSTTKTTQSETLSDTRESLEKSHSQLSEDVEDPSPPVEEKIVISLPIEDKDVGEESPVDNIESDQTEEPSQDVEQVSDANQSTAKEGEAAPPIVDPQNISDKENSAISDDQPKEKEGEKKKKPDQASLDKILAETAEKVGLRNEVIEQTHSILSDENASLQTLDASVDELILYAKILQDQEYILGHIPKIGLVKRSFEEVREKSIIPTATIDEFRKHLASFNQKRATIQKELESGKEKNLLRKKGLLQQLQSIVESEDPMRVQEVRAIQDEWKSIGHVPKKEIESLYKEYRSLLDKFYQMREMHFEMLDYDRRINLQEKERLISEIEKLIPEEEDRENFDIWKERMDQLQEYQQQWRAVGHIPREDMDRISSEYRDVVDKFFEVRQEFLKKLDSIRQANGEKKQEILKEMEAFTSFESDKPKAWNEATSQLQVFQEKWKKLGQAPQQINGELWHRYREICNTFFSKKSAFFKKLDEMRAGNLEKKRALCERVEAIEVKDGKEWEKSAKEIKAIQREWKQIGPVPERHSNKLWNRFRTACDVFFEQRRKHYTSIHEGEHTNLEKKKTLIADVKALTEDNEIEKGEAIQKVKGIQEKWKEIGKVPYKEKDKIWEEFRAEVDNFFNNLSLKKEEVRELKLKASLNMLDNPEKRSRHIKQRISRLRKKISQAKEKVDQYSINIQYISKGKSGDSLRNQIQKEIDKEQRIIDEWKKRIKMLNDTLKNPVKEEIPIPNEDTLENADSTTEGTENQETQSTAAAETKDPAETEASTTVEINQAAESKETTDSAKSVETTNSTDSTEIKDSDNSNETTDPASETETADSVEPENTQQSSDKKEG